MNEVQALKHRLSETLKAKQLGAAGERHHRRAGRAILKRRRRAAGLGRRRRVRAGLRSSERQRVSAF